MSADFRGLIISYAVLLGILFLGEIIRVILKLERVFTRKFIHVGVGSYAFIAYWCFEGSWTVLIPPASFIIVNALSFKWALIKSMEIEDRSNLGTIYYPVSICLLLILFWKSPYWIAPLVGTLVMALGDGFASIIGNVAGKHTYSVWKSKKSFEGSTAMFVFSAAAVFLILTVMTDVPAGTVIYRALVTAAVATVVEGCSPMGTDNLTVPILSALFYRLIAS